MLIFTVITELKNKLNELISTILHIHQLIRNRANEANENGLVPKPDTSQVFPKVTDADNSTAGQYNLPLKTGSTGSVSHFWKARISTTNFNRSIKFRNTFYNLYSTLSGTLHLLAQS